MCQVFLLGSIRDVSGHDVRVHIYTLQAGLPDKNGNMVARLLLHFNWKHLVEYAACAYPYSPNLKSLCNKKKLRVEKLNMLLNLPLEVYTRYIP